MLIIQFIFPDSTLSLNTKTERKKERNKERKKERKQEKEGASLKSSVY